MPQGHSHHGTGLHLLCRAGRSAHGLHVTGLPRSDQGEVDGEGMGQGATVMCSSRAIA